jgi:hypothetical protein
MKRSFPSRHAVVFCAVLVGAAIFTSGTPRTEAAPPRKPVSLSAVIPSGGAPVVLATLDGLTLTGTCSIGPGVPLGTSEMSLELARTTGQSSILASGLSFAGTVATVLTGLHTNPIEVSDQTSFGLASVGLGLIAGPGDQGGQPVGGFSRIDVGGTVIFTSLPTPAAQCLFFGSITPV